MGAFKEGDAVLMNWSDVGQRSAIFVSYSNLGYARIIFPLGEEKKRYRIVKLERLSHHPSTNYGVDDD